jgi:hypothetical protein
MAQISGNDNGGAVGRQFVRGIRWRRIHIRTGEHRPLQRPAPGDSTFAGPGAPCQGDTTGDGVKVSVQALDEGVQSWSSSATTAAIQSGAGRRTPCASWRRSQRYDGEWCAVCGQRAAGSGQRAAGSGQRAAGHDLFQEDLVTGSQVGRIPLATLRRLGVIGLDGGVLVNPRRWWV